MALYYITGISGSGKSAVRSELLKRRYSAVGTDEDGIAFFYHNETSEAIKNDLTSTERTAEWRAQYTWKVSRPLVEKLAQEARDKPVFLCGTVANENEVWDLFDGVFALVIDEETLKHRIATRTSNDFGKTPHEMADILAWNKTAKHDYERFGATIVDATQSVERIVNQILRLCTPLT